MNTVDNIRCQLDRAVIVCWIQSFIPVAKPEHPFHFVMMMQAEDKSADNVIQAGTQPAAGNDTA